MLTVCMFVCSPITAIQNDAGQFAGKYRQAIGRYRSSCRMVPSGLLASTIHAGDVYLV